jgi:hypothetical protein
MKLTLNQADLDRIKGKLNKLNFVTKELSNPSNPLYEYRFSIMLSYQNAVTRAMGSVQVVDYESPTKSYGSGYHSDVVISLQGLGSEHTSWKNLAPATVSIKRELGYRMKIWEASGDAKRGVRIHVENGFVGLEPADGEAYLHAYAAEHGVGTWSSTTWEKRSLFLVANHVVMQQKEKILARIKQIILTYVSWGS